MTTTHVPCSYHQKFYNIKTRTSMGYNRTINCLTNLYTITPRHNIYMCVQLQKKIQLTLISIRI